MGMRSLYTETLDPTPCDCCLAVDVEGQWWCLNNYFGISGYFCPTCFGKVSHNSHKEPNHPEYYHTIRVQQELENAIAR